MTDLDAEGLEFQKERHEDMLKKSIENQDLLDTLSGVFNTKLATLDSLQEIDNRQLSGALNALATTLNDWPNQPSATLFLNGIVFDNDKLEFSTLKQLFLTLNSSTEDEFSVQREAVAHAITNRLSEPEKDEYLDLLEVLSDQNSDRAPFLYNFPKKPEFDRKRLLLILSDSLKHKETFWSAAEVARKIKAVELINDIRVAEEATADKEIKKVLLKSITYLESVKAKSEA